MASSSDRVNDAALSIEEREWIERVEGLEHLAELAVLTGAETEHDAYFEAKERWRKLQEKRLVDPSPDGGFPGDSVVVDGQEFVVHGVTHASTDEEREFVQTHARAYLGRDHDIYCEQGIRSMYFQDFPGVCEMDDYIWAMHHRNERGLDSHLDDPLEPEFEGGGDNLTDVITRFRRVTFSLIESGSELYGDRFASALGDIASDFMLNHEELSTGEDFRSFRKSRQASRNPAVLGSLQRYYKTVFLPQPLEREWLRRHDPEIELFTHARNERLADYAVAHASASTVHLIVGAAHQPGVLYYLDQHRQGNRDAADFELVG